MDPNQKAITNLGSQPTHSGYTITSQAGYGYQYGPQMAAYQQPAGKLPGLQSFMGSPMGTIVRSYQPLSQDPSAMMTAGVPGSFITTTNQINVLPSVASLQGQGQVAMTTSTMNVLPSMGTFVSNPAGTAGMTPLYRNVAPWQGQSNAALPNVMAPSPASNTLPSFGQFFLPQQFQQPTQPFQNVQQHQVGQQLIPNNAQQTENLQNLYHLNQAMVNPGHFNLNHTSANFNTNFGALLNPTNANVRHTAVNVQMPCQIQLQGQQLSVPQILAQSCLPPVVASCNQITNTTPSIVTTTSTGTIAMTTANVHVKTAVSSVIPQPNIQSPKVPRCSSRSSDTGSLLGHHVKAEEVKVDDVPSQCSSTSEEKKVEGHVTIPFGWQRLKVENRIVYESPSKTRLCSVEEVAQYLATEGTCKCGLECPVVVNKSFNFDCSVTAQTWTLAVDDHEDMTKLCNHKRKIVAMATFQNSQVVPERSDDISNSTVKQKKESKPRKKKGKINPQNGPYEGAVLVSQMIAKRDKMKESPTMIEPGMVTESGYDGITTELSRVPESDQDLRTSESTNHGKITETENQEEYVTDSKDGRSSVTELGDIYGAKTHTSFRNTSEGIITSQHEDSQVFNSVRTQSFDRETDTLCSRSSSSVEHSNVTRFVTQTASTSASMEQVTHNNTSSAHSNSGETPSSTVSIGQASHVQGTCVVSTNVSATHVTESDQRGDSSHSITSTNTKLSTTVHARESSTDLPSCQQVATKNPVMSPAERGPRSTVKDPTDELGPISSGKQIKLDFSKVSTQPSFSGRMSQPLQSPTHPMISPGAGMMSPSHQMMSRSPSHSLPSPNQMLGGRTSNPVLPVSRPPSQPMVSPTGMNCQASMQRLISPNSGHYNPLMVQTSTPTEHYHLPSHSQMRGSPRFTFPPNPMMQHTGNTGMVVQMQSANLPMSQVNTALHHRNVMMGNQPPPPQAQSQCMIGNAEGMMGNSSQHAPGIAVQGISPGNMYQYNTPPPGYAGLPINYIGHPPNATNVGNPRPPFQMQPGMFHMSNPVLSGMFDQNWQEKKKAKPKKPRAKKEKKKASSIFESDTPPPNVDVSLLKDHGRGPIPKVKVTTPPSSSTSFLENPTAFLAEQTVLISNSLTSTLSSPPHSSATASVTEKSTDGKTYNTAHEENDKKTALVESVETTSSPNVVVHNTSPSGIGPSNIAQSSLGQSTLGPSNIGPSSIGATGNTVLSSVTMSSSLAAAVGAVISNVAKSAMESSVSAALPGVLSSNESHLSTSLSDTNIFTEDRCESLSPEDSNEECPALNETITPSSVVHHTPDSGKNEKSSLPEENEKSEISKIQESSSIAVPNITTEILSKFGPALVSVPVQNKSGVISSKALGVGVMQQSLGVGGMHQTLISAGHEKSGFRNRLAGNYNTLQQMLGHNSASQFPASNLLSAAARAQMAQQNQLNQNNTDILIGQQPVSNIHLNQPLVSKLAVASSTDQNLSANQKVDCDLQNILKHSVASVNGIDSNREATKLSTSRASSKQSFDALKKALASNAKPLETSLTLSSLPQQVVTPVNVTCTRESLRRQPSVPLDVNTCSKQSQLNVTLTTTAVVSNSTLCSQPSDLPLQSSCVTTSTTLNIASQPVLSATPATVHNIASSSIVDIDIPQSISTSATSANQSVSSIQPQTVSSIQQEAVLLSESQTPNNGVSQDSGQTVATCVASTTALTVPVMNPAVNAQNTILSSVANLHQNLTPQTVLNLFQNIGLQQQIQQGQSFNQMQNSQNFGSFQASPLVIPNSFSQEGVQCVQIPQNNFSINNLNPGTIPLVNDCGTTFSANNTQFPSFNIDGSFQNNIQKSGQLMQIIPGESQAGCIQIKNAMTSPSCDLAQPMNKVFTDQVTSSQPGQVVLLPNVQMPMVQVLGSNQPASSAVQENKGTFPPPFTQHTDIQSLVNQLQASLSQMGSPLGMVNMQQVFNNLTTGSNLTAMQLQTLQLQQQLLQQIQQLQGMQSLISQINIQGQGSNTITAMANKNNVVMTTGNAVTGSVTGSEAENSVSMITMVNDVSTTTESPPHPLLGDEEDENREFDAGDVTPGMGESLHDGFEEEDNLLELSEQNSVDSVDTFILSGGRKSLGAKDLVGSSEDTCSSTGKDIGQDIGSSCTSEQEDFNQVQSENGAINLNMEKKLIHTAVNQRDGAVHSGVESSEICTTTCGASGGQGDLALKTRSEFINTSNDTVKKEFTVGTLSEGMQSVTDDDDESLDVCSTEGLDHFRVGYSGLLPNNSDPERGIVMDLSTKLHHSVSGLDKGEIEEPSSSTTLLSKSKDLVGMATKDLDTKCTEEESKVMTRSKRASRQTVNPDSSVCTAEIGLIPQGKTDPSSPVPKTLKRPLEVDQLIQDEDSLDAVESPSLTHFPVNFTEGDLIWGQIRGFPSWPGKVVPPCDVIDPEPLENGKKWIKWYGDHTFTQVEQEKLKSLAEGLHSHHRAKRKRKGRKMNSNLECAIQEALLDMDPVAAKELEMVLANLYSGNKGKVNKKKRVR